MCLMLVSTLTQIEAISEVNINWEEHCVQYVGSWIIVASLVSVKCEPLRDGCGAYLVLLDDEHLIVHLVVQWTFVMYTIWSVFANLREVPHPEV